MSVSAQGIRSLSPGRRKSVDAAGFRQEERPGNFRNGAGTRAVQSSLGFRDIQSGAETFDSELQLSPEVRSFDTPLQKSRRQAFSVKASGLAESTPTFASLYSHKECEPALGFGQGSRRSYSRASSGKIDRAPKANDANFWFTKAKAVYSCRPFSPKKKAGPLSSKKTKGPPRRSASVASVWPVTEQGSGLPHKQKVSGMQLRSDVIEDGACEGTVVGGQIVGILSSEEDQESVVSVDQSFTLEQMAFETSQGSPGAEDSAANTYAQSRHKSQAEPSYGDSELTEAQLYTRVESGKSASTSSPSPPPHSPSRYLPRRSKSATDATFAPTIAPRKSFPKDGESLLEGSPPGGVNTSLLERPPDGAPARLRPTKSSNSWSQKLERGESDDERGKKRAERRRTWSALQLKQGLRGSLDVTPLVSPMGRSKSRTGKRSINGKFGSSRHRKRSYKTGGDRGLAEEPSRTSLDKKNAYEAQLNAERSVKVWAAENRPPRKGMELAVKAIADANAHLSSSYERVKNKAQQLEAQLGRLADVSANMDRSLSVYEELTRGDQEVLQKLEDASDVNEGEGMTTKRYEYMLTRAQEELCKLKGSVEAITKEVKAAERARLAVTQRQEHVHADAAAAREALARAKRELGGLHIAWHSQLDDFKQENRENEEAVQYFVRRERMRQRILRELGKNAKAAPNTQSGESASAGFSTDGALDVKLASYDQLTGLVGTRDVPAIISLYAERKENNAKLQESKSRAEERMRRLKDERAELEVALKQVVYLDTGQVAGAQAGLKTELQKKEDRLRREQERTLAAEREISLVGACLWQLLARIPDATDALQGLPAAYFVDAAAAATPNPQTPAAAPRHAPRKLSTAKSALEPKAARGSMSRQRGGSKERAASHERLSFLSARGLERVSYGSIMSLEALGEGALGSGDVAAAKDAGIVAGMTPEDQARFALETLEQVRSKVDAWLSWETAYLQDAGLVIGSDQSSSQAPSRRPSFAAGTVNGRKSTGNSSMIAVPSEYGAPKSIKASTASHDPQVAEVAENDVTLTSKASLPGQMRSLAPAFVPLEGSSAPPIPASHVAKPGDGQRRSADARRPLGKLEVGRNVRRAADPVAAARLKAEETIALAAMQAVRGRAENYRVDVGQDAFVDHHKSLEAITEWLRANRGSLRAHSSELDYDMSGTISTDELLELFRKVKFEPTPAEIRSLLWKLDRDGSGSVTINELLDSSDDEDNAAVFRQTALAPVVSREELKARTEKMARNQQHTMQLQKSSDGFLSPEQTQLVLQKLRAIDVTNPMTASANAGPPRGTPPSAIASLGSSSSGTARTGILKSATLNRVGLALGTARVAGGTRKARGTSSSEATPRQASAKRGGVNAPDKDPPSENVRLRRPDSAPSRGAEERARNEGAPEVKRKSRIAFVDVRKSEEGENVEGPQSRPTSASRGKVSGSASLSRPLSSSGYRLR